MLSAGLTESQRAVMTRLHRFFNSSDNCFIMKGYAGTGKTFLISHLTAYLERKEIPFILAAPTGRAARMLSQKTNQPSVTIHSLIYAGADETISSPKDIEQTVLNFQMKKAQTPSETVFIIDEASMVADTGGSSGFLNFGTGRLLCDLLDYCGLNYKAAGKRSKRKIIFVGDPAQLPPINQSNSPALSKDYLMSEFELPAEEAQLTEVIRQDANSGILNFATDIRDALQEDGFQFPLYKLSPQSRLIKKENFIGEWIKVALKNLDETAVITWTNELALYYNRAVRHHIFKTKNDAPRKGDRILVVNNNQHYKFLNGDIIEIKEISSDRDVRQVKNSYTGEEVMLAFRDVVVQWRDEESELNERYCKILENMLDSKKSGLSREEYTALRILSLEQAGIKLKRYSAKNSQKMLDQKKAVDEALKESEFHNALQVKYGYALTCHKAQGGEWQNVFLDFSTFGSRNTEDYLRWAYTAVTRGKETLYAINIPTAETGIGSAGFRYETVE